MPLQSVVGRVRLHRSRQRRADAGHLWVYDGEIEGVDGTPQAGDIVDVVAAHGRLVGRGFYNPSSKIRVRILTHHDEAIDDAFFNRRIEAALTLRRRVVADTTAYRLIYGDSDWLSGLVVDRYAGALVIQTLSAGMDRREALLAELLAAHTGVDAVYARNDVRSRTLEGLPLRAGFIRGAAPLLVDIHEGPAQFRVDIARGQKTGWFCDQRENRCAIAGLAPSGEVLDVFCHTGGFGIHALAGGAASVLGIDGSADALAAARVNADLNGVGDRCAFEDADAFDHLRHLQMQLRRFDLVILDPPAFTRSRDTVGHALAGYKDINLNALGLVRDGGFLVTCSCTRHVDEAMLWGAITEAAHDARRELRLIELRSQARDHPVLAAMPETRYLKCFILQVFS